MVRCSVCESDLDPEKTVILEEKEQRTTAHITCPKCNSATMVFLSNNQAGILSIGVATDLDSSEAKRAFGRQPISADEIIDLHSMIADKRNELLKFIER